MVRDTPHWYYWSKFPSMLSHTVDYDPFIKSQLASIPQMVRAVGDNGRGQLGNASRRSVQVHNYFT